MNTKLEYLVTTISNLLQEPEVDSKLRELGSIYGHCAVACEVLYIRTQFDKSLPQLRVQKIKPFPEFQNEFPPHFRMYDTKTQTIYDPTKYQFADIDFERIYDVENAQFYGFNSFRRHAPPYFTNRNATLFFIHLLQELNVIPRN